MSNDTWNRRMRRMRYPRPRRRPPAVPRPAPKQSEGIPVHETVSLVLLLALAGAVNLWATHHLGHGINPGMFAAVLSGVGFGSKWLLTAAEKSSFSDQTRRLARRLVAPPFLIALYLAAGVLGASYSSVLVVAPVGQDSVAASLTDLESAAFREHEPGELEETEGAQRRFRWVRTTPFGREYRLRVRGYLPEVITVGPILSRTVQPERDLRPAPSVLFRPPVDSFDYIGETSGCIVLCTDCLAELACTRDAEKLDGVLAIVREPRSVLVGSGDAGPVRVTEDWQLELDVMEADRETAATALQAWKNPRVVRRELEPGAVVTARILSRRGRNLGESSVTVGSQRLVDQSIAFRR